MSNSEEFLSEFIQIENALHRILKQRRYIGFTEMVRRASEHNDVVRNFATELYELAELRNAIAHGNQGQQAIAELHNWPLDQIRKIRRLLTEPPVAIKFSSKPGTLNSDDSLAEAVKLMYEKGYSQIPIRDDGTTVNILTPREIAKWLGAQPKPDDINLEAVSIRDVLAFSKQKANYTFLARHETAFKAIEAFYRAQQEGHRLDAVLITEHGKASEGLLGVLTVWDLPKIYDVINL